MGHIEFTNDIHDFFGAVQPSLRSRLFTWVLTVTTSTQQNGAISLSFCRPTAPYQVPFRPSHLGHRTDEEQQAALGAAQTGVLLEQQVLDLAIQHGMAVVGTADVEQQLLIWTALDDVVYRPRPPWR